MRKIAIGVISCAVSFSLIASGCGQKSLSSANGETAATSAASISPNDSPSVSPEASVSPAGQTLALKTYYADSDVMQLAEFDQILQIPADANKYLAALNALKTAPSDKMVSLCPQIMFHSADLKNGTLTVNITIPPEGRLGSEGEALLLKAWKNTLFQFSDVQAIELLVDGEQVDSLMGHMELPHPMKR